MRLLLTIFLTLCLALPTTAQMQTEWNHITREMGLTGESVNKIIIDHRGLVWMATSNGVCCFNGVQPMTISIEDDEVADRMVHDICEDVNHNIYIATSTYLYCLGKNDKAFRRIAPLTNKTTLLSTGGRLYVVNLDNVQVYNGHDMRPLDLGMDIKKHLPRSMAVDDNGNLWLLTDSKLLRLRNERVAGVYDLGDLSSSGIPLAQVVVCNGRVIIATKGKGLYHFDPESGQSNRIKGIGNIVNSICDAGNGRLCVATDGAGTFLLNVETFIIEHTLNTTSADALLPTDAVYCYLRDAQGNDWVGMSRYGLAYSCHQTALAHTYSYGDFTTKGLNVRSFCAYEQDRLIGTHQGFYYVDEVRGIVRYYSPLQLGGGHIVTDIARYGSDYYIATYDGGLWKFIPREQKLVRVGDDSHLALAAINVLRVSPDQKLWIGASTGVYVLDSLGNMTVYSENNLRMNNASVSAIVFDKEGNTWVCGNQGIAVFEKQSGRFVDNMFPDGFFNHVGYLKGCFGEDGRMFFGNREVYYTDQSMADVGQLSIPTKMLAESLNDLLADHQGGLWIATEKGLFRMTYDQQMTQHLGYSEGVSSQMIGRGSLRLSGKGDLWFATSDGLQWISLTDLERWTKEEVSRVTLYDIIKGGLPLSPTEIITVNEERHLGLSWTLGSEPLRVKTALQDYSRPDGRFFEYRLGDNGKWTIIEAGEPIVLEGLGLGRYQLTVRLMGLPGTETTYNLSVYPSKTAIAVLTLLLLTALLLFLLRCERKSSHVLRDERNLVEEALIETEQELEEVRNEEVVSGEVKSEEQTGKYQHMRISDEECADIVTRMRNWLETSRAYTNPELKRSDIAEQLKVPVAKLSLIFTLYLKENYYDFINNYRLAEFKRLLADGVYKRYTLTALSEQCGFKKSSFFNTFRKQEGMTPSEYLKRQNIKIKL